MCRIITGLMLLLAVNVFAADPMGFNGNPMGFGGGVMGGVFGVVPSSEELILRVKSDNTGTSNDDQFTLPLQTSGTYNFTATADGTSVVHTTTSPMTITFPSGTGTYDVVISGTFQGGVRYQNGSDKLKLLEIKQWGTDAEWTVMTFAFYGCNNMQITASDLPNTAGVSEWTFAFIACSSMTSFPQMDTSGGTVFNNTWGTCSGLTEFPALDFDNATELTSTWQGCTGLTDFPTITFASATSLDGAWNGCSGLTNFPLLDTSGITDFDNTWASCSSLEDFPLVDTSNGTTFNQAWLNCTWTSFPLLDFSSAESIERAWQNNDLTDFPLINTTNVTNMKYAWYLCNSLTNFPLLDTRKVTNFERAWQQVGWVDFDFPAISMTNMNNGVATFFGSKLSTASYSALLIDINAGNPNDSVSFHGGTSKYSSGDAAAARTNLVDVKSWTIVDGGLE